ncbi:hypothetical protein [Bradyrhizobium lablabi]|uniref:hypothetical protein n=1 Tax=Bradyrhizobium lablabi TaxID=722472 RepID=UPI001BAD61D9|nr:hypothetical protein [Bradyrhizobium lablabi]MBR0693696.1 hypothetical protein [Bradyrhizobium lablabi]
MTPEWVLAICAGVTLAILWTGTVIGAVLWITNRLNEMKAEILADFKAKHQANELTVKALESLVIRHDVILNPEFNGGGGPSAYRKHHPK